MLLTYDLNDGKWVAGPGNRFQPAQPAFVRGDSATIDVQFCRGGTVVPRGAGTTFKCGLKQVGIYDGAYLAYTAAVTAFNEPVPCTAASIASPTVISCTGHGRQTGEKMTISGMASVTPDINGTEYPLTRLTADTFSIPVAVTVAGTGGTMTPSLPPYYRFQPSLSTAEINAALRKDGDPTNDVPFIPANLEIEATLSGAVDSTNALLVTLNNDVNRGDETAPVTTGGAAGKTALANGAATLTVTFSTPLASAAWHFAGLPTIRNTTDGSPLGITVVGLTARTASGFTLALSCATDSANYSAEWQAVLD